MIQNLKLEKITRAEISQWKEMRKVLYHGVDDTFHDQEMVNIIQNEDWQCLFVRDDKKAIGFVELSHRNIVDGCTSSPVPYIEGIYLMPGYRQKGIGKHVVKMLKEWCIKRGYNELAADTELENEDAQKFFTSVGFGETYRTVGFRCEL